MQFCLMKAECLMATFINFLPFPLEFQLLHMAWNFILAERLVKYLRMISMICLPKRQLTLLIGGIRSKDCLLDFYLHIN